MQVKNFMEVVVQDSLENVINDMDVCKCDRCRADIKAISLNNLKPLYYVSQKGEVYSKVNTWKRQVTTDVIAQIIQAANKVNNSPNHTCS